MKELALSEKLAALPYEAKVRICFRLLKTAGHLREAKQLNEPRDGRRVKRKLHR